MKKRIFTLFQSVLIACNFSAAQSLPDNDFYSIKDFTFLRDTVYTLKPYFIEVNLATQLGYLHSRTDSIKEFGVSTGTKWLEDGVNTKEGLFVIQSMKPKWHSIQFDSTLMLNWMGFNYGIGFHALLGKGYYKYLGKKKSSHGCVRISREVAADIYSKIDLGTPVLVHSDNHVVTVAFADSTFNPVRYSSLELIENLKKRFKNNYSGKFFIEEKEPLIIDLTNVSHPGLPIGERKRLPRRQTLKPFYKYISAAIPKAKNIMLIPEELLGNSSIVQLREY